MNLFQNPNFYRNQRQNQESVPSDPVSSEQPDSTPSESNVVAAESDSAQDWVNNPALSGMDPDKLKMLTSLASQAQGKSQNELLPFLMNVASQTRGNNMSFQQDEIDAIVNVMKIGKTPQEIQRIDRLCDLMKQFRR